MGTMPTRRPSGAKLPRGVVRDTDRHGNDRLYFRAPGRPKRRLRETPGSEAFERELAAARLGIPWDGGGPISPVPATVAVLRPQPPRGSLRWLVAEYRARGRGSVSDGEFHRRLRELDRVAAHRRNGVEVGDVPYQRLTGADVATIRDELKASPGARDNLVRIVSALFHWAAGVKLSDERSNPCRGIRPLHARKGFHVWTDAEVEQYERRHPIGTTARLALALAMFTGLRRQELALIGPPHVDGGRLRIIPGKTSRSSAVEVDIPLLDALARIIAASPTGPETFLVSRSRRAFRSAASLGNAMQRWTAEAGLADCSLHGLRSAGATRAAENGATAHQLMAIFGWTTLAQAERYTRKAERRRMATTGIQLLEARPVGTC